MNAQGAIVFQIIEAAHAKFAWLLQLEQKLEMAKDWDSHFRRDFDDALARFEADRGRFNEDGLIGEIANVDDVFTLRQICFDEYTVDIAQFIANLCRIFK